MRPCVICKKDAQILVLQFSFCFEHGHECMKNYWLDSGDIWDAQPLSIATKRGCWIPVEEELPLSTIAPYCLTKYLVANHTIISCAFYEGFIDNEATWIFDGHHEVDVSHWMPLPELP